MSKIKQARAWLARKEQRTSASEKRGDLTIQQIIGIAVSVIVVGLVAAILVILVRNAGQDASDRAEGVSQAVAGDPAIYNGACPVSRGLRIGTIARVENSANAAHDIEIPWNAAGGYGVPGADFSATAVTPAAGVAVLSLGGTTGAIAPAVDVGFFAAAARITESRHNADFDGDGEIESSEVIGVMRNAAGDMSPVVATNATAGDSHSATDAGAGAFMLADPTADIPAATFAVGRQLIVNNTDSCWRIV